MGTVKVGRLRAGDGRGARWAGPRPEIRGDPRGAESCAADAGPRPRRPRRRRMPWVVLVLAALLVSGCTAARTSPRPAGAGHSTSASVEPRLLGMPTRNTCWRVPPEHLRPDYWFDASAQVPCSSRHDTQTAGAFTVPEPTVAMAKQVSDDCWNNTRMYIGVDLDHWIPWSVMVFLPSKKQVAAGASWVRCDVGIPAHPTGTRLVTLTKSVESAALHPPADLWACTIANPLARVRLNWHLCGTRHRYEETGTLAELNGLTKYPPRRERHEQGIRQCRNDLSPLQQRRGLTASARWDPPAGLSDGELVGVCWAYDPSGRLLSPRD